MVENVRETTLFTRENEENRKNIYANRKYIVGISVVVWGCFSLDWDNYFCGA